MPVNIKTHIERLNTLIDKLQAKHHKLQFDINNGIATAEVVELIEVQLKLTHLVQDLEHLNLSIDIAQDEIEKGKLEKGILDKLKSQLERDLPAADKKIKSALRVEKQATELYNATKLEKKEPEKKAEKKPEVVKEKKLEKVAEVKKVEAKTTVNAKKIDTVKDDAVNNLNKRIDEMGRSAYDILLRSIENTFDFKNGKIQGGAGFVKQLNKLTIQVLDLLQSEPKFTGPVSQFIKRMQPISDAITDFQKSTNGIKVPDFEIAKKIVLDEIVDKMLNNGLNQSFVQPLRDLIYQNVTGGLSLTDARTQIKEFISGGKDVTGKLGKYVEQTAQQAVDSYSGAINLKLLENFDYDGLLITGSLIDNSSKQCRFAIEELGGKITRENWPKIKAIGEKQSGWIEGTTFDNLPMNRLHWGCRHSFYPIILKKTA